MTTAIHHGNPGSFKTFGTIERVVIPNLVGKKEEETKVFTGRVVISNIRGLDSIERIEKALDITIAPDSDLINVEPDSMKGYDIMAKFFHWAPHGALIIIDESQRVYNKKRHRDLKCYDLPVERFRDEGITKHDQYPLWDGDYDRPDTVETAFDQHRHYNWDIYLITPNVAKLHPEIREVAEIAYRHKGRGHLLPWWWNKWREYAHDPEVSGKSASHYEGTPKTYKADKRVFACYQSTKTGKAKRSSEVRPVYRDPKVLFALLLIGITLPVFIWRATVFAQDKGTLLDGGKEGTKAESKVPLQDGGSASSDGRPVVSAKSGLEANFDNLKWLSPTEDGVKNRFHAYILDGYSVRLTALLTVPSTGEIHYRLLVESGDQFIDVFTPKEIRAFGYRDSVKPNGLELRSPEGSYLIRYFAWDYSKNRPAKAPNREDAGRQGRFVEGLSGSPLI